MRRDLLAACVEAAGRGTYLAEKHDPIRKSTEQMGSISRRLEKALGSQSPSAPAQTMETAIETDDYCCPAPDWVPCFQERKKKSPAIPCWVGQAFPIVLFLLAVVLFVLAVLETREAKAISYMGMAGGLLMWTAAEAFYCGFTRFCSQDEDGDEDEEEGLRDGGIGISARQGGGTYDGPRGSAGALQNYVDGNVGGRGLTSLGQNPRRRRVAQDDDEDDEEGDDQPLGGVMRDRLNSHVNGGGGANTSTQVVIDGMLVATDAPHQDHPGMLTEEMFADLPDGDLSSGLQHGRRSQAPDTWLTIRESSGNATMYLMLFWLWAREGARWIEVYTLAKLIDKRAKTAEKEDRRRGARGKFLLNFLLTDEELEGAVGRWNSIWHLARTGDVDVATTLLNYKPPGGGTAPEWAIARGQRTALYDMKTRQRVGGGRGRGNWTARADGGGVVPGDGAAASAKGAPKGADGKDSKGRGKGKRY